MSHLKCRRLVKARRRIFLEFLYFYFITHTCQLRTVSTEVITGSDCSSTFSQSTIHSVISNPHFSQATKNLISRLTVIYFYLHFIAGREGRIPEIISTIWHFSYLCHSAMPFHRSATVLTVSRQHQHGQTSECGAPPGGDLRSNLQARKIIALDYLPGRAGWCPYAPTCDDNYLVNSDQS